MLSQNLTCFGTLWLLYNFLIFLLGDFFSSYGAGGLSECLRSCVKWAIASQSAARVLSQSAPGAAPVSLFLWPISAPPPQLLVHFEQKQRKDETIENGQLYEVSLKLKIDQTHPEAAKAPLFLVKMTIAVASVMNHVLKPSVQSSLSHYFKIYYLQ